MSLLFGWIKKLIPQQNAASTIEAKNEILQCTNSSGQLFQPITFSSEQVETKTESNRKDLFISSKNIRENSMDQALSNQSNELNSDRDFDSVQSSTEDANSEDASKSIINSIFYHFNGSEKSVSDCAEVTGREEITDFSNNNQGELNLNELLCSINDIEDEKNDNVFNSASDSDRESDDNFFNANKLFPDSKKPTEITYVSAPTDSFLFVDDTDSETDTTTETVKFFINDILKLPMAEYEGKEYRIGCLDLTSEEYSYMRIIGETTIELKFNLRNIAIKNNKLNIKRINERQVKMNQNIVSMWTSLNLVRIQFSTTEPFLAKYENEVYFVGYQLYDEYMRLLKRTKMNPGTAIRIRKDRLKCVPDQTLEIVKTISFENQKEICVISTESDNNNYYYNQHVHNQNGLEKFRRYIIDSKNTLCEVEPILIHSSIHDYCTEIYVETDFPFGKSELNRPLKKEISVKKPIGQSENDDLSENEEDEYEEDNDDSEDNYEENQKLKMDPLRQYKVPIDIVALSREKKLSQKEISRTDFGKLKAKDSLRVEERDYIKGYTMMLHFEEVANQQYLEKFNQTNIRITYHMDCVFYFPVTDDLTELAAAIDENDIDFCLLEPKFNPLPKQKKITGQVLYVRDKKIYLEIFRCSVDLIRKCWMNENYDISFTLNRTPYQLQHNALHFVKKDKLFTRLINNRVYNAKNYRSTDGNKQNVEPEIEGTLLNTLNTEQKAAVEYIVAKNDVLPYILFGPPGTGKTRTLVAAIEQIVRTSKKNVLVCAMSNAACDEITERLLNVLNETELYRFFAKSYKNERINPRIANISNDSNYGIHYPSLKYLYKFRVIVCTLCSAGCFTRARKDKNVWKSDHFGYVIIDECASAHETMCLVPIAGLCTSRGRIHAKIILAGDPKQLDAVTRCNRAKQLGFNVSWMEQLCKTSLYSRNKETGQYNFQYITQLVKNYRSHPQILRIPNELFYENKLEACAAQKDINWYINSRILPSKQFPMIFRAVHGKCQRIMDHSCFNNQEVDEVLNVVKELLPRHVTKPKLQKSDIGVVTPYRKQRFKIQQRFRHLNFDGILVGTAETFQGKEKPVMIISTVRTDGELGFVTEPRRLNVIITRAKCLLIIIGDPHTLQKDANWLRVIRHCIENNSFIQGQQQFSLK